jgi:hypothetical protein
MNDAIALPDPQEIETWFGERCYLEQYRLRNELAFIQGDHAQGGPVREDFAAALRGRLAVIARRLQAISSSHEPL